MSRRRTKKPPAPPEPVYNPATATYTRSNRGITPRKLVEYRNAAVNQSMAGVDGLCAKLFADKSDVNGWAAGMRQAVKDAYTQQYMLGRGGREAMTQADWGALGNMLRDQYRYLDGFANDIRMGRLSEGQIRMRAKMYIDSAVEAYERGRAAARGLHLPAYPGDGKTPCRVRCKCTWIIRQTPEAYYCTWQLGHAEHCDGCLENAGKWAPLIIPRMANYAR